MAQSLRGKPRVEQGTVVRSKTAKTVVVESVSKVLHPKYKKYTKRRGRFTAHDESGQCRVGDKVEIVETRPMSKTKHWRVRKVLASTAEKRTV